MDWKEWFSLIVFIARIIVYLSREGNGDLPSLKDASEYINDMPTLNGKRVSDAG